MSAAPSRDKRNKAAHTAFLITPNSIHHQVANAHGGAYLAAKREESARIAADIATFEAAGGKVERLHPHAASRPLLGVYGEYAVAMERSRARGGYKKPTKPVDDGDESDDLEE